MKAAFPYRYILELRTFEYGCLVGLNIKVRSGTDEQPFSDKPPLVRCEMRNKLGLIILGDKELLRLFT